MTGLDEADLRLALVAADVLRQLKGIDHARGESFAALANKLRFELATIGRGPLVYRLALPLETMIPRPPNRKTGEPRVDLHLKLAPRLNEYAAMDPWTLKLARAELDQRIEAAKRPWPAWDSGSTRRITVEPVRHGGRVTQVQKLHVTGGRRRIIEVVRCSSREVDELAVDIVGGKLVVDRLIWAGVLAGDTRRLLGRIPGWKRANPREGRLEIAVYEVDQASRHHHTCLAMAEDAGAKRGP